MTTAQFLTKEQKELNAPQKEKQIQGIASTYNYYVSGGRGSLCWLISLSRQSSKTWYLVDLVVVIVNRDSS